MLFFEPRVLTEFFMNKSFRRARSSGLAHSKKSLVVSLKDQKLRLVVIKLTETCTRESCCLSSADEEEDGLACDAAESLEGQGSCRQTYRFLPKGQSRMMTRVSESFQLEFGKYPVLYVDFSVCSDHCYNVIFSTLMSRVGAKNVIGSTIARLVQNFRNHVTDIVLRLEDSGFLQNRGELPKNFLRQF